MFQRRGPILTIPGRREEERVFSFSSWCRPVFTCSLSWRILQPVRHLRCLLRRHNRKKARRLVWRGLIPVTSEGGKGSTSSLPASCIVTSYAALSAGERDTVSRTSEPVPASNCSGTSAAHGSDKEKGSLKACVAPPDTGLVSDGLFSSVVGTSLSAKGRLKSISLKFIKSKGRVLAALHLSILTETTLVPCCTLIS